MYIHVLNFFFHSLLQYLYLIKSSKGNIEGGGKRNFKDKKHNNGKKTYSDKPSKPGGKQPGNKPEKRPPPPPPGKGGKGGKGMPKGRPPKPTGRPAIPPTTVLPLLGRTL